MPAFVLALVLLGALAAGGVSVLNQVRMAPGTLLPAAALAPKSGGKGAPGTVTDPNRQTHAGPGWEVLNTPQKLALYPLAERWALLSELQKRRWLALAQNFPTLSATPPAHNRRMACWLYEGMLMFGVVFIAGYLFGTLSQTRNAMDNRHALQAFLFVVFGIYFTWFWAKGQTLAMKTWHIRVVDRDGRPLTQRRALLRYV
jgi:hypothetical protein